MKRITGHLYFRMLLEIVAGGVLGYAEPATAVRLKPLGDGFIALVKMLISPILGIDRFMFEARSLTNFIGNGVAAIVVAGWELELDKATLAKELA